MTATNTLLELSCNSGVKGKVRGALTLINLQICDTIVISFWKKGIFTTFSSSRPHLVLKTTKRLSFNSGNFVETRHFTAFLHADHITPTQVADNYINKQTPETQFLICESYILFVKVLKKVKSLYFLWNQKYFIALCTQRQYWHNSTDKLPTGYYANKHLRYNKPPNWQHELCSVA